jgi:tetratricopeptide (TPR) repeat protein
MAAADRLIEEAMTLAEAAGSMRALVPVYCAAARTRELQDRLEEALEHGRRWFELSIQAGERLEAIAACAFGLGPPLRQLGRLDEAWAATEEGLRIVGEMESPAYKDSVRWERVHLMVLWGRPDEADEELRQMTLPDDLSNEIDHRLWAATAAPVRAAQGRDAQAEALWRRSIGPCEADWFVSASLIELAEFLLGRGRLEDARPVVAQVGEIVDGTGAVLLERQVGELRSRLR